ncbi:DNA-binding CsgD family transcriptional regulator [Streptomyces canus]|uniref:DNA-binding CsgD family transcriptional regulator n=1 Tax=Streptomyces canus TaxID=58343 RepID=A0AAW8F6A6_9ACTN|nr:helix-turn-helix transcriptional regulator [Streptomyces canus]MDQ0904905.1 DNA-binding CsgD family transcriptional regulator [Streptomyces canus]
MRRPPAHARGLLDNDLGHLLRAVRLYEDCPRSLACASALEGAGRKSAATRRFAAVPHLDAALALCTEADAERDLARARRRLHALGVRRRTTPAGNASGRAELTRSEAGVVRLVAEAPANRQVAERLSLSPHTVSSHPRRAFAKRDVISRADLTRSAADGEHGK